ncbi:hypothetical protein R6Q59_013242 [Mikania micrantha]
MFLEHDDEHLTWVFAIDGLFLLNLFHNYNQPELTEVGLKERMIAQDVLMVENQIPFMVLKEIDEALHPTSVVLKEIDESLFSSSSGVLGKDKGFYSVFENNWFLLLSHDSSFYNIFAAY